MLLSVQLFPSPEFSTPFFCETDEAWSDPTMGAVVRNAFDTTRDSYRWSVANRGRMFTWKRRRETNKLITPQFFPCTVEFFPPYLEPM